MPEREVIEGVLEGTPGELLFVDATITVGETQIRGQKPAQTLYLATADKRRYKLSGFEHSKKIGRVTDSGRWAEVRGRHGFLSLIDASKIRKETTEVELRAFVLRGGDRIELEVTETGVGPGYIEARVRRAAMPGESAGLPAPPREKRREQKAPPTTAAALPSTPQQRRTPKGDRVRVPLERSTLAYAVIGGALFGGSTLAGWLAPLVEARNWLTTASAMGLATLFIAINRRMRAAHHSAYVSRAGGGQRITAKSAVWGYRADWVFLIVYAFVAPFSALESSPNIVTRVYATLAFVPLVHALLLAIQEAPFRRFASRVLGARSDDPRGGQPVLVEGSVKSSGPALHHTVDFIWRSETTWSTDEHGQQHEHTSNQLFDRAQCDLGKPAFEVDTPNGAITVRADRAHVAFAHRLWEPSHDVSSYVETLAHAEPVCVVGRFESTDEGLVAKANGDESLFIWAGSRRQLVLAQLFARARIAALLALALVPVATGTLLVPFAARFRAEGAITTSNTPALAAGTRCSLSLLAYTNHRAQLCKAQLTCGGTRLYGGWAMGQTTCAFTADSADTTIVGSDDLRDDGDPALRFDLRAQTATWSDHKSNNTVSIQLDRASPALLFW
jgi:hypothetical protein